MTRLEECERLAVGLSLDGTITHIQSIKEAERLTAYKIRTTTKHEIHEKIMSRLPRQYIGLAIMATITALSAFVMIICGAIIHGGWLIMASVFVFLTAFIASEHRRLAIERYDVLEMPLQKWANGLPYGALLAVTEAKQLGLDEFWIAFPSKHTQADPVIFAVKHGIRYEIFAWDDGKIYE